MINQKLNDATILQQLDGQWQRIATILLYKLKGRDQVKITTADMLALNKDFAPSGAVMFVHGHSDSFDLQVVDIDAAKRIADHEASMRGTG
jgi:hypothetical protein